MEFEKNFDGKNTGCIFAVRFKNKNEKAISDDFLRGDSSSDSNESGWFNQAVRKEKVERKIWLTWQRLVPLQPTSKMDSSSKCF